MNTRLCHTSHSPTLRSREAHPRCRISIDPGLMITTTKSPINAGHGGSGEPPISPKQTSTSSISSRNIVSVQRDESRRDRSNLRIWLGRIVPAAAAKGRPEVENEQRRRAELGLAYQRQESRPDGSYSLQAGPAPAERDRGVGVGRGAANLGIEAGTEQG
jgi:hypothetical protein